MVGTGFVWAGRFWRDSQIFKEAGALIGNSHVALDSRLLAANTALNTRNVGSVRCNNVGILIAFALAALDGVFWSDTIVAASRILAEVHLDAVSFGGHSARFRCGRFYTRNDNPL